jgi:hypothetical protein
MIAGISRPAGSGSHSGKADHIACTFNLPLHRAVRTGTWLCLHIMVLRTHSREICSEKFKVNAGCAPRTSGGRDGRPFHALRVGQRPGNFSTKLYGIAWVN